ncbi:hypothetical protein [Halomonas alkaliantarctica]|nr:hypothetical protein [Halomonas alkaliantarctica]
MRHPREAAERRLMAPPSTDPSTVAAAFAGALSLQHFYRQLS